MTGRLLVAVAAFLLILPRKVLQADSELARLVVDHLAVIGLSALVVALVEAIMSAVGQRPGKYYYTTILTGFLLGVLAGVLAESLIYAFPLGDLSSVYSAGSPDAHVAHAGFLRLMRNVVSSGLIGAALYIVLRLGLGYRSQIAHTQGEQVVAVGISALAVFLLGTYIISDIPEFGRFFSKVSFGLVDWIGAGACHSVAEVNDSCGLVARPSAERLAVLVLSIYFVALALFYFLRLRLNRVPSILGLAAIILSCAAVFYGMGTPSGPTMEVPEILAVSVWLAILVAIIARFFLWTRKRALVDALREAFEDRAAFEAMLTARLAKQLGPMPQSESYVDLVDAVVRRADHDGWIDQLVVNARFSRPHAAGLASIADNFRLGVAPPAASNIAATVKKLGDPEISASRSQEQQLENLVRKRSAFNDMDALRLGLAAIEPCVCRIQTPSDSFGTGFLVAPDLVVTNYHVVREFLEGDSKDGPASDTICLFDFKKSPGGQTINRGTQYRLSKNEPIVDWSPFSQADVGESGGLPNSDELDYAILRLERPAGEEAIGGVGEPGAPRRGWIATQHLMQDDDEDPVAGNMIFLVVQHPKAKPLQQDIGPVTDMNANKTRVRHMANTLQGSSGSPCFDIHDLSLIALHHAGKHSKTLNHDYNQAVPMPAVMKLIAARGKAGRFWELLPPSIKTVAGMAKDRVAV